VLGMTRCELLTKNIIKMNIEELKQIVKGNAFQESRGCTTLVVDLETVLALLDELKQCDIHVVTKQSELLLCGFCEIETEHIVYDSGNLQCKKCDWVAKP
jgi:hypothetical protein